jgi:hypothetical protein
LMMEVLHSSETSVLTKATLCSMSEGILHSQCCENLRSYRLFFIFHFLNMNVS